VRITVTVDDPHGPFQEQLLALLANHADVIDVDAAWTVERASRYFLSLPANAQRIVREAAIRDGYVPADELRDEDGSLRGHSAALKRAVERGVRNGWWPESMQPPITPQGPGFGKVVGYRMADGLADVFFAAINEANLLSQREALEKSVRSTGGAWDVPRAVSALASTGTEVEEKRARQLLRDLAEAGLLVKTDPDRAVYEVTDKED
jgi:hypothetical protein